MVSNTRLYGAGIAVASGGYSLWSATSGSTMTPSSWVMLLLGFIVLVHGGILLTDYATRLGRASGHLMIVYGVVMVLNQAFLAGDIFADLQGTNGGMGMNGGMGTVGWDVGMVILALLMLLSGVIMLRDDGMVETDDPM